MPRPLKPTPHRYTRVGGTVGYIDGWKDRAYARMAELGLTLDDLGAALGVTGVSVGRWLSEDPTTEERARAICDALDLRFDDLVETAPPDDLGEREAG